MNAMNVQWTARNYSFSPNEKKKRERMRCFIQKRYYSAAKKYVISKKPYK